MQNQYINIFDFILSPVYILIILLIARNIKRKNIEKHPEYKYYIPGLFVKIFGGLAVVLIYLFYYDGGDTVAYYDTASGLAKLSTIKFRTFLSIMTGHLSYENYWIYYTNVHEAHYFSDPQSFVVVRISAIFALVCFNSFFCTTILVATFTYFGIWKLYRLITELYPANISRISLAVLFVPSVFFWGSGILKDSYTLSMSCLFVASGYCLFIFKRNILRNIIGLVFSSFILISIKPYIFNAAFLGLIIMVMHSRLLATKNLSVKYIVFPIGSVIMISAGIWIMFSLAGLSNQAYGSLDKVVEKAILTQYDLKQEYYGGNRFDIGYIDPTFWGMVGKAPDAIAAGLFRPYIWETRNPVMFISGLENLGILFLAVYSGFLCIVVIFKGGRKLITKALFGDSFILFSLIFSLIFAFSVGLTTANFGALVRYRIPLTPFFVSALFIITYRLNREITEHDERTKFVSGTLK
ncbi:MAG: hypothetical protein ABIJ97_07300 [Bacteroidota bacterium]